MASTRTAPPPSGQPQPAISRRKIVREVLGLLLLFWGLFVLLTLLTYSHQDPGINHVVSVPDGIRNSGGMFGAYLSGLLVDVFGLAAFIWPVVFLAWGAGCVSTWFTMPWWRWMGFLMLGGCLITVGAAWSIRMGDVAGGGMLGMSLHNVGLAVAGPVGSSLLWLFVFFMSMELTFSIRWMDLLQRGWYAVHAQMEAYDVAGRIISSFQALREGRTHSSLSEEVIPLLDIHTDDPSDAPSVLGYPAAASAVLTAQAASVQADGALLPELHLPDSAARLPEPFATPFTGQTAFAPAGESFVHPQGATTPTYTVPVTSPTYTVPVTSPTFLEKLPAEAHVAPSLNALPLTESPLAGLSLATPSMPDSTSSDPASSEPALLNPAPMEPALQEGSAPLEPALPEPPVPGAFSAAASTRAKPVALHKPGTPATPIKTEHAARLNTVHDEKADSGLFGQLQGLFRKEQLSNSSETATSVAPRVASSTLIDAMGVATQTAAQLATTALSAPTAAATTGATGLAAAAGQAMVQALTTPSSASAAPATAAMLFQPVTPEMTPTAMPHSAATEQTASRQYIPSQLAPTQPTVQGVSQEGHQIIPPQASPVQGMPQSSFAAHAPAVEQALPVQLAPQVVPALPPLTLLDSPSQADTPPPLSLMEAKGEQLMACLSSFGIRAELVRITPGPVVTLFELRPGPGVKVSRILGLTQDIAMSLKALAVRIHPLPGQDTVGIEIPNEQRATVNFRRLLGSAAFQSSPSLLTLALGSDIGGASVTADLARMPHLLVGGTTGSGKSVCVNALLLSLLYKATPDEVRLLLIDPKVVELAMYADLPHLIHPVVSEPGLAKNALEWAVHEMEQRYALLARAGVRNIHGYNEKVQRLDVQRHPDLVDLKPMPFLVIIVDELADLMLSAGKDVETAIVRLAQLARAAGIHLIIATQRPSVDVVTGLIKANFPSRIAFKVANGHDSRTILDGFGAEALLGNGDMLFKPSGATPRRLHGPFVSDADVEAVVAYWKSVRKPDYALDFSEWGVPSAPEGGRRGDASGLSEEDAMYEEIVQFALEDPKKLSISKLQRRFRIGFNKAARFVERMQQDGIIPPPGHANRSRDIITD